mgnify:CR=1 FL=1
MVKPALVLALAASGVFLVTGMIVGVWKYRAMLGSPDHRAPMYVDIAHRAALLYSFASLVIAKLLEYSPYSIAFELAATAAPLFFFAATIVTYIALGVRREQDTQFRQRTFVTTWGMYLLIVGEIGGVAVLLAGALRTWLR